VAFSKGQTALDLLLAVVVLFVLGFAAVIGYQLLSGLNTEIQASPDMSNTSKAYSASVTSGFPATFDGIFIFALVLLWVFLLVTSFLIDTHPVFFVVTILLLFVTFFVGMAVSNAYQEFTTDASFSSYAAAFPMTGWVMEHLLIVIIIIGFTSGVALYAKSQT